MQVTCEYEWFVRLPLLSIRVLFSLCVGKLCVPLLLVKSNILLIKKGESKQILPFSQKDFAFYVMKFYKLGKTNSHLVHVRDIRTILTSERFANFAQLVEHVRSEISR